jgi:hypothetical protein
LDKFSRVALFETVWRAFLSTLAALLLMAGFISNPPGAFLIGAHVALFFAVSMIVQARRLTDEKLVRSDAWLAVEPAERPIGAPGRLWAREHFVLMMLRFAKGGAAIAVALAGLSLLFRA